MATVPVTQTFTAKEKVTAAKLNAATKTPLDFLLNPPRVNAFSSAATSVASSTSASTLIALESESWDTDSMHSTTTNTSRIYINTTGQYLVSFYARFPSNATGYRLLNLRSNSGGSSSEGTTISTISVAAVNGDVTFVSRTFELALTAGDYYELFAQQNSGTALTLQNGQRVTGMEFRWLGIS
ncbi:hypothetical protein RM863_11690 [Streptomyces sp. DSM 41014]|uniref:C1q domain-containing protein n=1 Tax=Streptomyces hintoniae TaxID=3075521 RepID=A0ABU2UHQ0_9ACTN|nr:hypothetical protein [Streptomyces sp. DSM 41014]MDT0472788.1 hypothetical protein [Streptomyces sp. DSM 41014]